MPPEPGEEVLFHGHPSWRSMLGFQAKGLLAAVLAGVIAGLASTAGAGHVQDGWVAIAVLLALATVLVGGTLTRLRTTYSITSQRLRIETGLLSRALHETRLERIQNVNATQTLLERVLRVGNVDFDTAAGAQYDFTFAGVADPQRIVRTVDRALGGPAGPRGQP